MNYAQDIQISCYGARKLSIQQAKHCPFVDWLSASVWNTTSSTMYMKYFIFTSLLMLSAEPFQFFSDSVMDSLKQYNLDQQDALVERLNSFFFSKGIIFAFITNNIQNTRLMYILLQFRIRFRIAVIAQMHCGS